MKDRLNIGCGRFPIPTHENFDLFPGPGVDTVGSVESLPYPDASFQEVHASQVLEHVLNLDLAVREIARVLRPGGLFVARVPYGIRWLYDPFHHHAFSRRTLLAFVANNAGLQSGAFFDLIHEEFTDWEMPFRWHVQHHLPSLYQRIVIPGPDGKERLRFPLGRRMELTQVFRRREAASRPAGRVPRATDAREP